MAQPSKEIHSFSKGNPTPVLIVGAGPAGFMAAATLSRYGIPLRIIDKRPSPIQRGHASGLQPRIAEIFHSLGLQHELAKYSNKMTETSFWFRENGELKRSKYSPEKEIFNPTNYPYVNVMHQGHTERIFVEDLSGRGVEVERPVEFVGFETSEHEEFPLNVRLKNLVSGMVEEVPVKHVLGCDGGRSTVRKSLKIESLVHQTSDSWAVADVFAATNFPDARRRCAIRTNEGSMMIIPHTNNGMRLYTLLTEDEVSELSASKYEGKGSELTNDKTVIGILTDRAKSLLHPFKIEIKEVEWVSMYHIAQRIADSFCDVDDRVFILGDACHTHSPKAGQGMNVSMNDAYNLTWKLALTLRGRAKPSLLQTYQTERQYIAKQLVDFDEKFSHLFASPEKLEGPEFHDTYVQNKGFTSGCGHQYPPSALTDERVDVEIDGKALEPLRPGKRLLPITLTRYVDGSIVNILDDMPSNGQFHIVVFAGDALSHGRLDNLSTYLSSSSSPLIRFSESHSSMKLSQEGISRADDILYNPTNDPTTIITLYLVHTSPHLEVPVVTLPAPFPHWKSSIYEDINSTSHGELGVHVNVGALVVVRPDGYVGLVTGLEHGGRLGAYFERILNDEGRKEVDTSQTTAISGGL